ncbi:MAG TPA: amidophosphoribosyltransferase [Bryobacteraceae bacterium]|nr:amidophosphoribosyltransferase [Bryobacteraceae bacterium]HOL72141.1 amidophosphoribosyltransferase [Bryobacteraceae bacterium]HOQ47076.1 amidophosphoribosyltransferase [Bryobacteraceae bacterium]HPQ13740.1 amidophosphoribosyltransferase [Bryobacteraceae bacterium]HPU71051.1 amidophosphoribosyltransferase [Bryobacteraceae bacterium]
MADKFREECGVVAVYGHPEASNLAYLGLYALQHRGQESAGMASSDGRHVYCVKEMGYVADVFTPERLATLPGTMAIAHTRYSTAGEVDLQNAQPFAVSCNKGTIAVAHNGNLTNAAELRRELEREGAIFQASSDTEVVLHLVARSRERTIAGALREALLQMEGAFSLVFLAQDRVIVARDPQGFRPLVMGQMELSGGKKCYVFASETCAFDLIGAVYMNEVEPGEMVIAGPEGLTRERYVPQQPRAQCVFEHVYFSRPDSIVFGRSVQESRHMMGRLLARESPVPADVVVPVPDSGVAAAIGFAAESGLPFRHGLIRSHYIGRTFIEPTQAIRDFGVKLKLNPVRNLLDGKRVVLVDDSIVRGTTSRKIVRMVRQAGAREVHMRISCPPTISPCFYGVDTPTKGELIAANNTVEEIRRFLDADSLAFLSMEALREAVGDTRHEYCYACYTGEYPTELVNITELVRGRYRRS